MALSKREEKMLASIDRDESLMVESLCMDREYLFSRIRYALYLPLKQLEKFQLLCARNYDAVTALRKKYLKLHPGDKLPKNLFHHEWEELTPLMQLFTTQAEFRGECEVVKQIYRSQLEGNQVASAPASTVVVAASSVKSTATCTGSVPSVPNTKLPTGKSVTSCNKSTPPPAHVVQRDLIAAVNKVASYSSRPTSSHPIPTRAQTLGDASISRASTDRSRGTSVVQKDAPYKIASLTSVTQTPIHQSASDNLLSMTRALNIKADTAAATADAASSGQWPTMFTSTELSPQVIAFLKGCEAYRQKRFGEAECEKSTATLHKTHSAE